MFRDLHAAPSKMPRKRLISRPRPRTSSSHPRAANPSTLRYRRGSACGLSRVEPGPRAGSLLAPVAFKEALTLEAAQKRVEGGFVDSKTVLGKGFTEHVAVAFRAQVRHHGEGQRSATQFESQTVEEQCGPTGSRWRTLCYARYVLTRAAIPTAFIYICRVIFEMQSATSDIS